ncbi:MAG: MBL fold metallo-hydrolase [Deltaproteobacteria bacterium]|nr:MBL fold metallo-hydrolase [Deltaproteobacteria bacterium]
MRSLVALSLIAALGCGRAGTVARGSVSVLLATKPAPRHDDPALRPDVRLSVHWVGHATTIVQLDDRLIATDPAVTPTVGVLAKRLVAPGVAAADFPALDLVIVSHVHFDHLSYASLEALEPKIPLLALQEGGLAYLPEFEFDAVETPHWAGFDHRGMRVTAVPARHGGWRYGFDASARASGGWVIERNGVSVYFAGDTGYDDELFRNIRARWPALDVALLPIAPMEPRGFVWPRHMNPADALQALSDLGAKVMIPIHYDTFINSLDRPGEAPDALRRERDRLKIPEGRAPILQIGERRVLLAR